jgi:uncharacterized protein
MWRVVFDTNLLVSSILVKAGLPAQALQAWRDRRFLLAVSPAIIREIRHTLAYDRIRRKYHLTDEDIDSLVLLLEKDALVVDSAAGSIAAGAVPDDPDDEQILACALAAEADFIVSGDRHLLDSDQFANIPIIPVREFLHRLNTA